MLRIETSDGAFDLEGCPSRRGQCPPGSMACYPPHGSAGGRADDANQILQRFDALPGSLLLLGFAEDEEPLCAGSGTRGRLYQNSLVFVDDTGEWLPVWAVMDDEGYEGQAVTVFRDRERALAAYRRLASDELTATRMQ